ncbi:MAG: T9SS type A sorting domain-containing protein [Chitinophagaceae bacterium]|nr:T9SS type A sorting domain-containing protein [Chitinophagaceae bacterium]
MSNGTGILGDQSSAQSCLAVPAPGTDSVYLFTTRAFGSAGARYNIIDMGLDGGLGAITEKNVSLFSAGTEELAGTQHCNAKDFWIVVRENVVNEFRFHSYLLSASGLAAPVISSFSFPNSINNTVGSLTFSTNGSKLIFNSFSSDIYIFNFDIETGLISSGNVIIRELNQNIYSTALSPDATKLYVSSWTSGDKCRVVQYDITAPNIGLTRVVIDSTNFQFGSPNGYGFLGELRLAPDQRIYISRWNQEQPFQVNPETFYSLDSLDAILSPNLPGIACSHQRNYLYLDHKPTMLGLPNFISNYLSPSQSGYSCAIPMPVELSDFNAKLLYDGRVELTWRTFSESNSSHFIAERTDAAAQFNPFGTIPASGYTTNPTLYSIIDYSPLPGINYYRLKIMDIDGKFEFSKIVTVRVKDKNGIMIFPNPANEFIDLYFSHPTERGMIQIYSYNGEKVLEILNLQPGAKFLRLDVRSLAKGSYIVRVISETGISSKSFWVQ